MKALLLKILLFFRDLFLHLRVAVTLRIGRSKVGKEAETNKSEEEK